MPEKDDTAKEAGDWKREIAEILRRHGKVDAKTCGKLTFVINCGGIRDAAWSDLKVE